MPTLRLGYLDAAPLASGRVQILSNPVRALEHLRDHVLSRPESYAWCLIVPRFRELFNPDDVNRLARQLSAEPLPESAQELYDGYSEAIRKAVGDAIRLGWHWAERRPDGDLTWHAFGCTGLYVVGDERVVRTAYIRAQSAGRPDRREKGRGTRHPLPRSSPGDRRAKKVGFTSVPADTPQNRYQLFKASWDDLVRSAFGDACLHRRVIPGAGRMADWRNRRMDYMVWAQCLDPAASSVANASPEGDQSHETPG